MAKYRWETIKKQYIQGIKEEDGTKRFPSQKQLCKIHGCSPGTLGERASNENWKGERAKFRARTEQKSLEKKSDLLADDIVEDDLLCEKFGRKALEVAQKQLDIINRKLDAEAFIPVTLLKFTVESGKIAQDMIKTAQGEDITKIELDAEVRSEHRFKHTLELLGTDEFREQELGVLRVLSEKEEKIES